MVLPSSMSLTAASMLAALRLSSRASWAIRSMKLLAYEVRSQHRATKDTTRPKRLFWGCATKMTYLLRLTRMGRPSPGFPRIRKPSTCGFYFAKFGMVEGDWLNVVDRRVSWRTNQAEAQNSPPLQKKRRQGSKMPRGQEAARGAKKRGLFAADRGIRHGVSAAARS